MRPRIPEPNFKSLDDARQWAEDVARELDKYFKEEDQPAATGWSTTNATAVRAADADGSQAHIGDVLCTLIDDLLADGTLNK